MLNFLSVNVLFPGYNSLRAGYLVRRLVSYEATFPASFRLTNWPETGMAGEQRGGRGENENSCALSSHFTYEF